MSEALKEVERGALQDSVKSKGSKRYGHGPGMQGVGKEAAEAGAEGWRVGLPMRWRVELGMWQIGSICVFMPGEWGPLPG